MRKRLVLGMGLVMAWAGPVLAGPERMSTTDPVYNEYGNSWQAIKVAKSTTTVVLISSAAENAGLGIKHWRFREIINTSDGALVLFPNNTAYSVFTSTYSIVLSSGVNGAGDSWKVPGDAAVYGIWHPAATTGGAGGSEHYWR